MFLSNSVRCFLILGVCAALAGCGSNAKSSPATGVEPSAPIKTREPAVYQAELLLTSVQIRRNIFIARRGSVSRIDFDYGSPQQKGVIRNDREVIVSYALKIFAYTTNLKSTSQISTVEADVADSLLAERDYTNLQSLGRENNLAKFSSQIAGSAAAESIIYVDESIGIPVRQEFYSIASDGLKVLQYSVVVQSFSPSADSAIFSVPTDFKKVTAAEFAERLSNIN